MHSSLKQLKACMLALAYAKEHQDSLDIQHQHAIHLTFIY